MTARRKFVVGASAAGAAAALVPLASLSSHAQSRALRRLLNKLTSGKLALAGKVAIELPDDVRYGVMVPITVSIDSPMTKIDRVTAVHLLASGNPTPLTASFFFSAANGKAQISTRIRLAKSQAVLASAEMSDGSFYLAQRQIGVAVGAVGAKETAQAATVTRIMIADGATEDGTVKAKKGAVIEIRIMIAHPMGAMGAIRATNRRGCGPKAGHLIKTFEARYDGARVFRAALDFGVSAHPYIAFFLKAEASGTLELTWTEDTGKAWTEKRRLKVE